LVTRVYLSNISRLWPLGKQERLFAEQVPGWPDVPTYCDTLPASVRKAHNVSSLGGRQKLMTDRANMLRPTSRNTRDEVVYIASLACFAWGVADFSSAIAAMGERGATLVALHEGITIPPDAGARSLAEAVKAFVSAKRSVTGGGTKAGVIAAAATKRAMTDDAVKKIKDRWHLPTKDHPTWQLLAEAKLSLNTVVDRLGKRPAAQREHQKRLKREARKRMSTSRQNEGRAG
jgi:hypothetical protein